jgi:PiT family inorganic phosphate transporter
MDATFVAVGAVVIIALTFDFANGFHDADNAIAIATPISGSGLVAAVSYQLIPLVVE